MGIEAAIIGSAVVGAGASAIGGSKAAKAQTKAAAQSAAVEREGLALQDRQYQQSREDLAPWREAGAKSLGDLVRMTQPGYDFSEITRDPGYQFRADEGRRSLAAILRATGQTESGAGMKEAIRFGDRLATDEFGNSFNRLSSLAGIGQTATTNTATLGSSYGANAGATLSRIGDTMQSAGNARASSYANAGAAIGGLANSIGGYYAQQGTLNKLMAQRQPMGF